MRALAASGLLAQLADCIALRGVTPPGDAREVAGWVRDWATEFGARVELQPVWPGADNVLVSLDFGPGPCLVFNTHLDVVDPAGQDWATDPFTATVIGERVYGRGSSDAKGSLVGMLAACERLAAQGAGLHGRLLLTAVAAEEAGGLGSLRLVRDGFDADAAVVGEPTGLQIARAHKGTYMHRLTFTGRAAHSASPALGRNAIADAAAFVAAAERETRRLAALPHPVLGPATMTVTTIAGGTFQNTVPAGATLTVDRRLIPGETHADCDAQRDRILAELAQSRPGLDVAAENIVATVASETAAGARIVAAALAAVTAAGYPQHAASGFNAGSDMSKLVGAGVPTVICGPGSLAQAHGPDEYAPIDELVAAVDVYEHLARAVLACGAYETAAPVEPADREEARR